MAPQAYGGDDDGVLPGSPTRSTSRRRDPASSPDDGEAPPYEEIAEAAPDVILAPYSGITEEQYELLSEIAPTVAYPDERLDHPVARRPSPSSARRSARPPRRRACSTTSTPSSPRRPRRTPSSTGKTVAAVWDVAGTFYVYTPEDSRVEFLSALGLEDAPAVAELANGDSPFFYTLSATSSSTSSTAT